MRRDDFEQLRDLPGKFIRGNITLSKKQATQPLLCADNIIIENDLGYTLKMNVNYNPETGAKGINVVHVGEGPICRLDVDGAAHGDAGRSHKHAVRDERSVRTQLANGVTARPELAGKSLREVFEEFCTAASIRLEGEFRAPDEDGDEDA